MTDEDINKLAAKLTKSLATKEDLESLVTKEDLKYLATKEDIKRLEKKIDDVDKKASSIFVFAEGVDEVSTDHERRLNELESISTIAHQIKK